MVHKITETDPFDSLLGQFGVWQLLIVASLPLIKLSTPWLLMSIVFLTPSSTFWCTSAANDTTFSGANDTCYDDCVNYEYDVSPMENTIVSEWDLVCDRRWMASFTQTVVQLGVLIGSALFGLLSDRYGRKKSFLLSVVLLIVFSVVIPFSPNFTTFTILRFFAGVSHGGNMVVSFVLLIEIVGSTKYRGIVGSIYQLPHCIGYMSLPIFAYYFRNWDSYILALAVPQIIYLGYFFLLPESPRWLVSKGRIDQATLVVKKAAVKNNLPTANIKETLHKLSTEISKQPDKKLNYLELCSASLRKRTICASCIWLIAGMNYYGLTQFVGQTSPNPFISVAVAGASQIPSGLVVMWLTSQFGRRISTATFFVLESVCIIALGTIPNIFWLKLALGSLGVSCAAIAGTIIYIQTSELYPTVVRNMAIGVGSTAMRAGSMIAPFVSNSTTSWLPTVIFGLAPVIAAIFCLCLPETKGKTMADGLEE